MWLKKYSCPVLAYTLVALISLLASVEGAYSFAECKDKIHGIWDGSIVDEDVSNQTLFSEYVFVNNEHVRGFDWKRYEEDLHRNASSVQPYFRLNYKGCKKLCGGSKTGLNDVYTAFAILTTWVLPAIALFSNLPFDSPSNKRKRRLFEAFTNWIGSPQSALANTMFNIHIIRECRSQAGNKPQIYKDAYYVLSCINQYEYPSYTRRNIGRDRDPPWSLKQQQALQLARDEAVLYGLFRPLTRHPNGQPYLDNGDIKDLRVLLSNLAHQLRMHRRRGVYPQSINVLWFLVAFAISLVTTFADMGDNTAAHSLSLGVLLSWLPVLITMMVVDRNPTASTRCRVLIERWLYNVSYVLQKRHPQTQNYDELVGPTGWWSTSAEMELLIGDFIGQGRRLRYCGIANAMLTKTWRWRHLPLPNDPFPDSTEIQTRYSDSVYSFRKLLIKRPWSWWIIWLAAQFMVSISAFMAFMISFNTPTQGLGCRSFVCFLWWLLSSVSWVLQAIKQEPPPWTRRLSIPVNAASTFLLLLIMMLQVTNGMNNCYCKTVLMGTAGWGGYTDLENAGFYKLYFHVERYWASAATMGMSTTMLYILWGMRKWAKSAELWKADEEPGEFAEQDDRIDDPVDLKWLI